MKKILIVICILLLASPVFAGGSKEILTLKRDLVQERVLRIRSEMELLKVQYDKGQDALKAAAKELEGLTLELKTLDGTVAEDPKRDAGKK